MFAEINQVKNYTQNDFTDSWGPGLTSQINVVELCLKKR